MLALGKEVTVRAAGEHLEMARDGSVSTVVNGALLTYLHVYTRSLSLSLTGRRERPGDLHRKRLKGTLKTLLPPGVLLSNPSSGNCGHEGHMTQTGEKESVRCG